MTRLPWPLQIPTLWTCNRRPPRIQWESRCRVCGLTSGPWRTRRKAARSGARHMAAHHPRRRQEADRYDEGYDPEELDACCCQKTAS